jgi:hypothetical protein
LSLLILEHASGDALLAAIAALFVRDELGVREITVSAQALGVRTIPVSEQVLVREGPIERPLDFRPALDACETPRKNNLSTSFNLSCCASSKILAPYRSTS